jgi:hypothetical protein
MFSNRIIAVGISVRARNFSDNCAVLGYYVASGVNFIWAFEDNLPAQSSEIKHPKSDKEISEF